MKKENLEEIQKKIINILKDYNVKKAGIFGSFVRGEQKRNSDVDVLVELDEKLDLFDVIQIKLDLEKAIRKKVDLVEYNLIRPELKDIILNEEVVLINE